MVLHSKSSNLRLPHPSCRIAQPHSDTRPLINLFQYVGFTDPRSKTMGIFGFLLFRTNKAALTQSGDWVPKAFLPRNIGIEITSFRNIGIEITSFQL
jgi:hypothetical protein